MQNKANYMNGNSNQQSNSVSSNSNSEWITHFSVSTKYRGLSKTHHSGFIVSYLEYCKWETLQPKHKSCMYIVQFLNDQLTSNTNLFNKRLFNLQIMSSRLVHWAVNVLHNVNKNTKSLAFTGLNQIILNTKDRFTEELRRCCNV